MSEHNVPEQIDLAVEGSLLSRGLQYVTQLGGTAVATYLGYKGGLDDIPVEAAAAVGAGLGVGLSAFGTRLGIERGAAARRNDDRKMIGMAPGVFEVEKHEDSLVGVRGAAITGTAAASLTGLLGGLMEGAKEAGYLDTDVFSINPKLFLLAASGLAVAGSLVTARGGRNMDSQPVLHHGLHIV